MSNRACSVPVKLAVLSLSIVAMGAAGCDGGSGGAAKYFPMKIGATWNFNVTPASGVPYTDVTQNAASSPPTLTQTYTASNGWSSTTSYQIDSNGTFITSWTDPFSPSVQNTCSPPCLLLPSNTAPGFSTSSTSTETRQGSTDPIPVTVAVTIDGIETVVVPAGTFSALKVTRAFPESSVTTMDWYAPGVGLVKTFDAYEVGTETSELASYDIP